MLRYSNIRGMEEHQAKVRKQLRAIVATERLRQERDNVARIAGRLSSAFQAEGASLVALRYRQSATQLVNSMVEQALASATLLRQLGLTHYENGKVRYPVQRVYAALHLLQRFVRKRQAWLLGTMLHRRWAKRVDAGILSAPAAVDPHCLLGRRIKVRCLELGIDAPAHRGTVRTLHRPAPRSVPCLQGARRLRVCRYCIVFHCLLGPAPLDPSATNGASELHGDSSLPRACIALYGVGSNPSAHLQCCDTRRRAGVAA